MNETSQKPEVQTSETITATECAELERLIRKLHASVAAMNKSEPYAAVEARFAEERGVYSDFGFTAFVGSSNMFTGDTIPELLEAIAQADPAKLRAEKIAALRAELAELEGKNHEKSVLRDQLKEFEVK